MKYQALILIFVILISASTLQSSVFSNEQEVDRSIPVIFEAGAGAIFERGSSPILNESRKDENASQKNVAIASVVTSEALSASVVEKPVIEKAVVVSSQCSGVDSSIFFVKDFKDEQPIFEKGARDRWPIASITKLMTTLVALEKLDLRAMVDITPEIKEKVGSFGTLDVDGSYSVEGLVYAALMTSSNDAAYALAYEVGYDDFIGAMNEKAKELGMTQTTFVEPSGLSYLNQSTAQDLFTLVKYIYNYRPIILEATRTKTVSIKNYAIGKYYKLTNINAFAGTKAFFGGKTGYIDESGGNLVTLMKQNGTIIALVVLGSSDRFGDTEKLFSCVPY